MADRTARSAPRARSASRAAQLAKARQRQQELVRDREARDERIVLAVADVYERQEERDAAARALELAEVGMGEAITRILAEGVPIAQVAELTDLSVGQVQKLRSAGQPDPADAAGAAAPGGGAGAAVTPARTAGGGRGAAQVDEPPSARRVEAAAS